ncbi:MAG: NADPH-dependent glutamate synthase [Roseovarius sp.]
MARKTIRTIPQERAFMPLQDPALRARNFDEVALGFDEDNALLECQRCLMCPQPACVEGCPVGIDIPGFIQKMIEKDWRGAYELIGDANLLPAVCGRVCPQEDQCEGVCPVGDTLEPVAIGRLERYVGDLAIARGWQRAARATSNRFRVGIVGAGPAGMACAADLAKAGCAVTVYEALHEPGGVLRYGIPEFRLPNRVVDAEIGRLLDLGIEIKCNTLIGRLFTVEQMIEEMGFHAVFIGTGAGSPRFMDIPGENLNGVLSANELLTRCNLMQGARFPDYDTPLEMGRKVTVIGAGNTAMDAMRVCLRLGAETVACVYRRSEAESPARREELHHAQEEGIAFHWLTSPIEILGDEAGHVRALRCLRMELAEPDASGRRRPVPVADSEHEIETDMVVYAIGTSANPILGQTSRIALDERGYIRTDENLATSLAGVYAGGDIVTGSATVILAMGAGRRAAQSIKRYLGIRDGDSFYAPERADLDDTLFGIPRGERNFTRLRLA